MLKIFPTSSKQNMKKKTERKKYERIQTAATKVPLIKNAREDKK